MLDTENKTSQQSFSDNSIANQDPIIKLSAMTEPKIENEDELSLDNERQGPQSADEPQKLRQLIAQLLELIAANKKMEQARENQSEQQMQDSLMKYLMAFAELLKKLGLINDGKDIPSTDQLEAKLAELQQQLQTTLSQLSVTDNLNIAGVEDKESFVKKFNDYASQQGWLEGSYGVEASAQGKIDIHLPSGASFNELADELAASGERFTLVDVNNNVAAYSDGQGQLKSPENNQPVNDHSYTATGIKADGFDIPSPSAPKQGL